MKMNQFNINQLDDEQEFANDSHERRVKKSRRRVINLKEPNKKHSYYNKRLRSLVKTNMSKADIERLAKENPDDFIK